MDRDGRRSRQIDVAIFDNLYSPPLFPDAAGVHIPVESVYAVFEVKPTFSRQWLRRGGGKSGLGEIAGSWKDAAADFGWAAGDHFGLESADVWRQFAKGIGIDAARSGVLPGARCV